MAASKKDIKIMELETALEIQTANAQANRKAAIKLFLHLIEINKWMADINETERVFGGTDAHIDFSNKMINNLRNKIKNGRSVTVIINNGDNK